MDPGGEHVHMIGFTRSAQKDIRALPDDIRSRVLSAIQALADNPRPHGVKQLKGSDYLYRIRVGAYRVVYRIHDNELEILIIRVRHRSEVYRNLP
jgi:mRNA interferase RelE/StbE